MFYHLLISLPLLVCLFWAVFFLIRCVMHNGEVRVNRMLTLFYAATTVLYGDHWMYFSGYPSFAGEWSYAIVNLSVYPLFYMYLRALVRTHEGRDYVWMLMPALVIALSYPLLRNIEWGIVALGLFARVCFAAQVVWVWVQGSRLLQKARKQMDDTYSDYRSDLLRPINILLQLFGVTAVASMLLNVIGRGFFAEGVLAGIPAVIMTILLYGLGYVAADTVLPRDLEQKDTEEPQEGEIQGSKTPLSDEEDVLMTKIDQLMCDRRLYRNPSLTIHDLASAVGSNRTYVSNCINRNRGLSFSQYVATFRVANVQRILTDPRYHSDHDAIADAISQSGFLTDQTFYRVFKETTGATPLQYRQRELRR